ncbi:hypothetical protein EBR56_01885, partial [bacterium]|nr:hypothetical protein [bacterium]
MNDLFDTLAEDATRDTTEMFRTLADSLRERRRWHALFDLRLLEARAALGLPISGELAAVDPVRRDALDERSLAACREVGWPLLDEGASYQGIVGLGCLIWLVFTAVKDLIKGRE